MSKQLKVFLVFLQPWLGLQPQILPSSLWRFPARGRRTPCCSSLWPTCSGHENFWPTNENCLCSQIQFWFSTPCLPCRLLAVISSNTGPISVFPWIQPFGSVNLSSRGNVYSRHVTGSVNCQNSLSFVMKYCPASTVVRNPASVQTLINRSGCGSLSTRSFFFCNRFLVQELRSKVWDLKWTIWLFRTMGWFVLPQQVSLFLFDSYCILQTSLRLLRT